MSNLGPITTVLETEVKRYLRNHGIVIWLNYATSLTVLSQLALSKFLFSLRYAKRSV